MPKDKPTTEDSLPTNKPFAFVIMPFEKAKPQNAKSGYRTRERADLDKLWSLLKKFLEDEGYDAKRSDTAGNILQRIVQDINKAHLIVVVLTGINPNVMYELGIAHGLRKKTLLLTKSRSELPFDLKGYNCEEYKYGSSESHKALRRILNALIGKIRTDESATFGPVETHLEVGRDAVAAELKRVAQRRLKRLSSELAFLTKSAAGLLGRLYAARPSLFQFSKMGITVRKSSIGEFEKHEFETIDIRPQEIMETYPSLELLAAEDYIPKGILSDEEDGKFLWIQQSLLAEIQTVANGGIDSISILNMYISSMLHDVTNIMKRLEMSGAEVTIPLDCTTLFDEHFPLSVESFFFDRRFVQMLSIFYDIKEVMVLYNRAKEQL